MNVYVVAPLLSVAVYAALVYFALRHPRRRERLFFALYLSAAGCWSFVSFLLHVDEPLFNRYVLLESRLLMVAFAWMAVTYYVFIRSYVALRSGPGLYLATASVPLVGVLAGLGLLPKDAHIASGVLYLTHGWALYLLAAITLLMAAHSVQLLVRSYGIEANRHSVTYLLSGLAVVIFTSLTNLDATLARYPIDHLGNLANALVIAYVIWRYRLFQVKLVLRRGIVYSVSSVVLVAAYLLVLFIFHTTSLDLTGGSSFLLAALLALALALVFTPLRNFTERQVERLLFQEVYRYRKLMLDFSTQIATIPDLEKLARETLQTTIRVLDAQWAGLLLPDEHSGDYRLRFSEGNQPSSEALELRLRREDPLVSWFALASHPVKAEMLDVLPLARGMWATEREAFAKYQVALICPIVYGGQLTSLLVVGPKQEEAPYREEQLEVLMTIANALTIVIENARTLDSLRKQQQRTEQLLAQVVAAQEEERKRIAAELHDGAAQLMVRVLYQLQIASAVLNKNSDDELRTELADIQDMVDSGIKEIRRVLVGLRPPDLEHLGLVEAMRRELERLTREGIKTTWQLVGRPVPLPSNVETCVYRIVQEALNNVRNHAVATRASLTVQFHKDQITIELLDNGKGFDVSRALDSAVGVGHLGLWGMKQRAQAVGGALSISSTPKSGTVIWFTLAVPADISQEKAVALP